MLGQGAVHGAFAGYTGFTVGLLNTHYAFLPIPVIIQARSCLLSLAACSVAGSSSTSCDSVVIVILTSTAPCLNVCSGGGAPMARC